MYENNLKQVFSPNVLEKAEENLYYSKFGRYQVKIIPLPQIKKLEISVYGHKGESDHGLEKILSYITSIYLDVTCEHDNQRVIILISSSRDLESIKMILDILVEYFEQNKYHEIEIPNRLVKLSDKPNIKLAEPEPAIIKSEPNKFSLKID